MKVFWAFIKKMKFGSHRHICDFSQNTFFGWHFLSSNDAVPDRGEWWPLLWATEAHKPSEWRPKTVIHPPPMSFHPFKFLSNSTYPWWYSPSMEVRRNHFSFSKIFQIQVRHCHKNKLNNSHEFVPILVLVSKPIIEWEQISSQNPKYDTLWLVGLLKPMHDLCFREMWSSNVSTASSMLWPPLKTSPQAKRHKSSLHVISLNFFSLLCLF